MQASSQIPFDSTDLAHRASAPEAVAGPSAASDLRKVGIFLGLVVASIVANYFSPAFVKFIFYATLLVFYYRSKNEAFWLSYFLVLSDGFFGFFGLYGAMIALVPGLPEVEVAQLYILLSVVKAASQKPTYRPFYAPVLFILGIYLLFLLVQGYVLGVSGDLNVQFRIFKWVAPLLLLYSIPRLFERVEQYREAFIYLFAVAFAALGAQLFTITTSQSPGQFFNIQKKAWYAIKVSEKKTYRGLFNDNVLIITYFASLLFLALKPRYFSNWLLYAVIAANFGSAFLSATRGWVLCFSLTLIGAALFVFKFNPKRLFSILALLAVLLTGASNAPVIGTQLRNAYNRMLTLEALAGGDITAGGTLVRLSERGPRVLKKWDESQLTGWGFSTGFMDYNDFHVGNQNILLHSGILGFGLMLFFFGYFLLQLFVKSNSLPHGHPLKSALLVFVIYFFGWFLLHSTSQQLFSYYQTPGTGIIQAVFFSLSALLYQNARSEDFTPDNT